MTTEAVQGVQALEVTFRLDPFARADGKQWVTIANRGGEPLAVGFLEEAGEAVAAFGSGEGWPRLGLYAHPVAAMGALMEAVGRQIAQDGGDDG